MFCIFLCTYLSLCRFIYIIAVHCKRGILVKNCMSAEGVRSSYPPLQRCPKIAYITFIIFNNISINLIHFETQSTFAKVLFRRLCCSFFVSNIKKIYDYAMKLKALSWQHETRVPTAVHFSNNTSSY